MSRAIVQLTPEVLSATEILSASTVKRIPVKQRRFLKGDEQVRSWKFQGICNLQDFILKLRVTNYELNLQLQSSKKCSKF